jgi:hypothetical protein
MSLLSGTYAALQQLTNCTDQIFSSQTSLQFSQCFNWITPMMAAISHKNLLAFSSQTDSSNSAPSPSPSHIATDGQIVSQSRCRAPSGAHDQIFITVLHLWSCFCGAPSLTRRRVCLLHMLLALASAVFLGSECLGTRDHIVTCWASHATNGFTPSRV